MPFKAFWLNGGLEHRDDPFWESDAINAVLEDFEMRQEFFFVLTTETKGILSAMAEKGKATGEIEFYQQIGNGFRMVMNPKVLLIDRKFPVGNISYISTQEAISLISEWLCRENIPLSEVILPLWVSLTAKEVKDFQDAGVMKGLCVSYDGAYPAHDCVYKISKRKGHGLSIESAEAEQHGETNAYLFKVLRDNLSITTV